MKQIRVMHLKIAPQCKGSKEYRNNSWFVHLRLIFSAINFFVKIVEFCVVYESVLKIKKIGNKIFFNIFQ